jgi:hypothetical protein
LATFAVLLYNEHCAELDQEQTEVDAEEDVLNDWNKRYLSAAARGLALTARSMRRWAARV